MKKTVAIVGMLIGCAYLLLGAAAAQATVFLMDNKLLIDGYFKEQVDWKHEYEKYDQQFHSCDFTMLRSSMLVEALYKTNPGTDLAINYFGGFRYFYELMPELDHKMHDAIPYWNRSDYQKPSNFDLITEAYVDIIKGPLEIKAGKQIVVWGETDMKRAADVINPLDLRYGSPGTEDWESLKIGLWMFRGLYQTDLPGQLLFETIIIPGDFRAAELPVEGTQQGASPGQTSFNPGKGPGIMAYSNEKARRDVPHWDFGNTEVGFKVRGYTAGIDWSVFYFNTLSDVYVADPGKVTKLGYKYVFEGLKSILTGSRINPKFPGYEVFDYKRYQVIGGTNQTIIEKLHGSEWRFEWYYEIGNHYNKAHELSKSKIYDIVKRDAAGFGLVYADRFTLPYITHKFFQDKKITVSVTWFAEKILGKYQDIILYEAGRGHRAGRSSANEIAWSFQQQFWESKWMFMMTGTWNPIGKTFICPILSYAPGNHWRWEAATAIYGSSCRTNNDVRYKDFTLFRVRYEY